VAVVTLRPSADGTTTGWTLQFEATFAEAIDDDPDAHDGDDTRVLSPSLADGTMFVELDDVPADFDPDAINSITIKVAHKRLNTPNMAVDLGTVTALLTRADESTAISTTPTAVDSPIQAGYEVTSFTPSPTGSHTVSDWNGARLALVFDHTSQQATDVGNRLIITAAEVTIDYTPTSLDQAVDVPAISIAATAIAPTLSAGGASVSAPNVTVSASALAPTIGAGAATLAVPGSSITATALAPTVASSGPADYEDSFDGPDIDATKWDFTASGDVTAEIVAEELVLDADGALESVNATFFNIHSLDLTDRGEWTLEVVDVAGDFAAPMVLRLDDNNKVEFWVDTGSLKAIVRPGGGPVTVASATYSPTNHRWLRIRYDSGADDVVWEVSTVGVTWNEFARRARDFALTALQIEVYVQAGFGDTATLTVDNAGLYGPQTITVPAVVISALAPAPTVSAATSIAVPGISLGATVLSPTVDALAAIAVPIVSASAVALAPNAQAGVADVSVPNVSVVATAPAPNLQAGVVDLSVPNISVGATALAPVVGTGGGDQNLGVPNVSVTSTALAVAAFGEVTVSVALATVSAPAIAPAAQAGGSDLAVPNITMTATALAPSVSSGGAGVATPAIEIIAVAAAPTVGTGESTLVVPNVAIEATASAPFVSAEGGAQAVSVGNIGITALALAPTVDTVVTVGVASVATTATATAPTVEAATSITLQVVTVSAVAQAPSTAGGGTSIVIPGLTILTMAIAPTVDVSSLLSPPLIAITALAAAPSLATEVFVEVPGIGIFAIVMPLAVTGGFEPLAGAVHFSVGVGRHYRAVATGRSFHHRATDKSP
jgi:hypothetical protein